MISELPASGSSRSIAVLTEELLAARIVDPERLTALLSSFHGSNTEELLELLVESALLTRFQADRAAIGQTASLAIGPFLLLDHHGPGVFGPMYRAVDRVSKGEFAVRVLPLRSMWRARQSRDLVRTLATLPKHPGLMPLSTVDSACGFHFMAWPIVEGESLADLVQTAGPLLPEETPSLLTLLADLLAGCHVRNLVHGALSPRVVLLADMGGVRVTQLGAGALFAADLKAGENLLDSLSRATAATTCLDYCAPEVLLDPASPTPAADQYSLGAVGYYALTGVAPYVGDALQDRLAARSAGAPRPVAEVNPAVPLELAAVIDRMLLPNPADRFTSMQEIIEQLGPMSQLGERPTNWSSLSAIGKAVIGPDQSFRSSSSSPEWVGTGSSCHVVISTRSRAAERDDSDASIQFDLTEPVEMPEGLGLQARRDTRPLTVNETREDLSAKPIGPTVPRKPAPELGPTPALTAGRSVRTEGQKAIPPSPVPSRPSGSGDAPVLAKPLLLSTFDQSHAGPLPRPPQVKSGMPTPVLWHKTGEPVSPKGIPANPAPSADPDPRDPAPPESVLWKSMKRNLLFWQPPSDTLQVSIYGPTKLTPGRSARVAVVLHQPAATDSVRTLARAFQQEAELIGTGFVSKEVARDSQVAVHLSVTNAGVERSLVNMVWRGQPHRVSFDLHVPWESPSGPAPGLVSIGRENVRIGKIGFELHILPRRG